LISLAITLCHKEQTSDKENAESYEILNQYLPSARFRKINNEK